MVGPSTVLAYRLVSIFGKDQSVALPEEVAVEHSLPVAFGFRGCAPRASEKSARLGCRSRKLSLDGYADTQRKPIGRLRRFSYTNDQESFQESFQFQNFLFGAAVAGASVCSKGGNSAAFSEPLRDGVARNAEDATVMPRREEVRSW